MASKRASVLERQDGDAVAFFQAMQHSFAAVLAVGRSHPMLVEALATHAFDVFERNVALQSAGMPDLACDKGCWACRRLPVAATAPELLLLARYIRRIHATPDGARLDLPARIADAAAATGGPETAVTPAKPPACPLVLRGVCIVHPVRPLACRGHAAFDRRACALAIAGQEVEVPVSEPHAHVRAMVQNALQAALRQAGYAWRSYALIGALHLLLRGGIGAAVWLDGEDVLEPALAPGVDWAALGAAFDAVAGTA